jgi:ABC-type dipeptide/oligopeptide/nickel transport system ATPase component
VTAPGVSAAAVPAAVPLLEARGLSVRIGRRGRGYRVVDEVSLQVADGGSLGIVGESGSGKSLTLRALMALLPAAAAPDGGTIALHGAPVPLAGRGARAARRGTMAMVFQDSLSALDPVQTVGAQIAEVPRRVLGASRHASQARAVELLDLVGIPSPAQRAGSYPHQLSGGMRQRVAIAIALATEPQVLLCDEPTTALDVTVQAQVLELIRGLRDRLRLGLIFVSHDIAVVRQVCDDIAIMYAGRIVGRCWARSWTWTTRRMRPRRSPARCPTRLPCRPAARSTRAARWPARSARPARCRSRPSPARPPAG